MLKKITVLLIICSFTFSIKDVFAEDRENICDYEKKISIDDNSVFDLAFNKKEFVYCEEFSVNPDSKMIAYSVRQKPNNIDLNDNPAKRVTSGSRIYISEIDSDKTIEIDPIGKDNFRPVWSFDGQKLAFYSDAGGFCQLWVYELSSKESKIICNLPIKATAFPINKPYWSLDSKIIYVPLEKNKLDTKKNIQSSDSNKDDVKVKIFTNPEKKANVNDSENFFESAFGSNLAAIDVDTKSVRIVVSDKVETKPGFLKHSSSGKWISYIEISKYEKNPCYSKYNLAIADSNKKDHVITIDKDIISKDGLTRDYIWHPQNDLLTYVKNKKLYLVEFDDIGPKKPKQLCEDLKIEFIATPLLFTKDGKAIVVGARLSDYQKPLSLFVIPLDQKRPIEIPFEKKWEYLRVLKANSSQIWQPDNKSITILLEEASSAKTAVVRFNFDKNFTDENLQVFETKDIENSQNKISSKILWKGFAQMDNFVVSRDENYIFCSYEDLVTPINIYSINSDFSKFKRISKIDPRLDKLSLPTKKIIETTVPLYNGELKKVRTTILLPNKTKKDDVLPGIVLFYPGSKCSRAVQKFCGDDIVSIQNFLFLHQGYALILPDVLLGPMGEGGNPVQEIVDVLLPQIYHAVDLGYVDINRLGLIGQSYGGYGTAAIITKTNVFNAAVAISGAYDLGGSYGYFSKQYGFFNKVWAEYGQGRMGSHPWNDQKRYIDNSPYYFADKIHTPFLMIHGENDSVCDVKEAEKLFAAMQRLNLEAHLAVYPDQGHVISQWKHSCAIDASKRIFDFFDDHLNIERKKRLHD